MAKKEESEKDYYNGVTFLNFQSGSPDQPTDRLLELLTRFVIDLQKEKIRVYSNIQIGKPTGGGCPPGGCHE